MASLDDEADASSVPVIATRRLILRAHRPADLPACAAMWSDPAVVKYIGGRVRTPAQSWLKLLEYRGLWALLGYGYWAIEESASRRFVGELGFADFKRSLHPALDGSPEAGWVLAAHAHGNGYATEALAAALAWGDRHLAADATACIIEPANVSSLRLATRAGYVEAARASFEGATLTIFRRYRSMANVTIAITET